MRRALQAKPTTRLYGPKEEWTLQARESACLAAGHQGFNLFRRSRRQRLPLRHSREVQHTPSLRGTSH